MTALSEATTRKLSISKLQTVVGALSGIAAAHSQQARSLAEGFEAYCDTVARSLAQALALAGTKAPPASLDGAAIVVFGAEHGFAGGFSERLLDAARGGAPADKLFVLGARTIAAAHQRRAPLAWTAPMASHAAAVSATARRVADGLYEALLTGGISCVEVIFASPEAGEPYGVVRRPILPLGRRSGERPRQRTSPLLNLAPHRLLEALVGEYVFAELARAALESFASENAARLSTLQSARFNIGRKLDELTALERQLRQDEITAEVQEVVSGALSTEGLRSR